MVPLNIFSTEAICRYALKGGKITRNKLVIDTNATVYGLIIDDDIPTTITDARDRTSIVNPIVNL